MPNQYFIQSVTNTHDGNMTIVGAVNGFPVTVTIPFQVFGNTLLFQAYIAPFMLAQVPVQPTAIPGTTGGWTI